ncbi:MAG: enoyl-CoA hydratase-related protein [Pseudomonadota bacterium]
MFETIKLKTDANGVCRLKLDRPDKHNALSARMIAELTEAIAILEQDPKVRVIVLTGEGKSFCSGADLGWMQAQFSASRDDRIAEAMKLSTMLATLNTLSKPVIACVNGHAFGGALGLIACADIAIAVDTAQFAFTETRLGLIPATISPFVLAKIGESQARASFLSAHRFDAGEALRIGLVHHPTPAETLNAKLETITADLLSASPEAVRRAKSLIRSRLPAIDAAVLRATAEQLAACWETDQAQVRVSSFLTN